MIGPPMDQAMAQALARYDDTRSQQAVDRYRTNDALGRAAILGDRRHDIQAGLHNAMPAIGAAWGYGGRAELAAVGLTAIIDHAEDLPATLQTVMA